MYYLQQQMEYNGKTIKFSKRFLDDYVFYNRIAPYFKFSGKPMRHTLISSKHGMSAQEAFYVMETFGDNAPCREIKRLRTVLKAKAGINFQIKEWAVGRADGTLPKCEFSGNGGGLKWKLVRGKYIAIGGTQEVT